MSTPDDGHRGTSTPTKTYQTSAGQNHLEYQETITVCWKTEEAQERACRQPDSMLKIQN